MDYLWWVFCFLCPTFNSTLVLWASNWKEMKELMCTFPNMAWLFAALIILWKVCFLFEMLYQTLECSHFQALQNILEHSRLCRKPLLFKCLGWTNSLFGQQKISPHLLIKHPSMCLISQLIPYPFISPFLSSSLAMTLHQPHRVISGDVQTQQTVNLQLVVVIKCPKLSIGKKSKHNTRQWKDFLFILLKGNMKLLHFIRKPLMFHSPVIFSFSVFIYFKIQWNLP